MDAPPEQLQAHLRQQLGVWPPTSGLDVVTSTLRDEPGWDGLVCPLVGVRAPALGAVLCVAAARREAVEALVTAHGGELGHPDLRRAIPQALGVGEEIAFGEGVYRWTQTPVDLPDTGEWVDAGDSRLPAWLRPFRGGVLAAFEADGSYLAGVGIKDLDRLAQEIAVGTESAARGRGLARALVATAAREILRRGAVPLYIHVPHNHASAKVAQAAGFPDRGWRLLGLWPADELEGSDGDSAGVAL